MKKKKLILFITPMLAFMTLSMLFGIPFTVASFIEYFTVDTTKPSFIDSTTENFICYPLEDSNNQNLCAIGWGKTIEESTGTLEIPQTVTQGTGNEAVSYQVKAIAECGFRFCNFSQITFAGNNVEEIKSEAFYSCQNITTFTMPEKCIHGVGPSSFMDCRSLTKVDMTHVASYVNARKDTAGFLANNPYKIGDHAFASCVSLKGFTFPINLTEIGESAFNNCKKFNGIFLPSNNQVNTISIAKYAFSDCTNLTIMYFESNVTHIGRFCFAQDDNLRIFYNGNKNTIDSAFEDGINFRKRHVGTNSNNLLNDYVPIVSTTTPIQMDEDHPGFIYFKSTDPIKYTGAKGDSNIVLYAPAQNEEYAVIYQWEEPSMDTDDYDFTNKVVTFPDEIDGAKVRVITEQLFQNDTSLTGVVFNSNLIQICKQAFKGCTSLSTIDFSDCTMLREIGHEAFSPNGTNSAFTGTISIPPCVQYIGIKAFQNFKAATGLTFNTDQTTSLLLIGNSAFENLGENVTDTTKFTLDLIIPKSMCDGAVRIAMPYLDNNNQYDSSQYWCIGTNAFANCPLYRSVTMQDLGNDLPTQNIKFNNTSLDNNGNIVLNPRIGFGTHAFYSCDNLMRFKGSEKMMRIGAEVFRHCPRLKEIFLSTYLKDYEEDTFLWGGLENNSIFCSDNYGNDRDHDNDEYTCEYRDLIIYVDGGDAPVRRNQQQKYYVWNSDPKTYSNEYLESTDKNIYGPTKTKTVKETKIGRLIVPTYYNVDYHTAGVVQYVDLTTGTRSNSPSADYKNTATLIKHGTGSSTRYIVTKCYETDPSMACIDLTTWSLGGIDIDTIGSCAFSTLYCNKLPSKHIILPRSVVYIRDRAFYSTDLDGIQIVSYKDNNGVEVVDTDVTPKTEVCLLPSNVERIEEYAFYNNDFKKVVLSSKLAMMGNSSFLCGSDTVDNVKVTTSQIESFSGSGSNYTYINGAMYDKGTKTLLYSAAANNTALDLSSLDVNNGTIVAVGARALAGTKYTSINFPGTVTTIYGGAFNNSRSLTQITGLTGLKYIGSKADSGEDVWTQSAKFSVHDLPAKDFTKVYEYKETLKSTSDPSVAYALNNNNFQKGNGSVFAGNYAVRPYFYKWIDSFGAFANCTSLTTFNLDDCSSTIKKIGLGAFEGCSSLVNMTSGTTTYTYYRYSDFEGLTKSNAETLFAAANATVATRTSGVVDLSGATNLKTIGRNAFRGCSQLEYFHLPMLYDEDDASQDKYASFYLGFDYDDIGTWYSGGRKFNTTESIFEGTKAWRAGNSNAQIAAQTGAVLLGESAQYIHGDGNYFHNQDPQTKKVDDTLGNTLKTWDDYMYSIKRYAVDNYLKMTNYYYYVDGESSFYEDTLYNAYNKPTDDKCKYWIEYTDSNHLDHTYILFDSSTELKAFYEIGN